MEDLTATEHDRDLDLVALLEELGHLAGLGVEVAGPDLGPVLHLLDPYVDGLALRLLGPLRLVELVLAEIHDAADGRVGPGGHLDEVEVEVAGDGQRLGQELDAELLPIGIDQAHLAGTDAVIDARIGGGAGCYSTSLPVSWPRTAAADGEGAEPAPGRPTSVGLRSHRPVARVYRRAGHRGRVGDSPGEAPLPRLSVALGYQS